MASEWPNEVTPRRSDPIVQQIAELIPDAEPPQFVKRSSRLRPLGNCYWNVAAAAEEYGGEIVYGWALLWWPGRYGTAMHHAVWRHPNGKLLDVTEPQPPDRFASQTLFAADQSIPVDLDRPPCIDNRHVLIADDPRLTEFVKTYAHSESVRRQSIELAYGLGYRAEGQRATARGHTPTMGKFNPGAQMETFARMSNEVDQLKRRMGTIIREIKSGHRALRSTACEP